MFVSSSKYFQNSFFPLLVAVSFILPTGPVLANECVDTDGDGWGWNGHESCQIDDSTANRTRRCFDEDGDGWGWNGVSSCRMVTTESNLDRDSIQNATLSSVLGIDDTILAIVAQVGPLNGLRVVPASSSHGQWQESEDGHTVTFNDYVDDDINTITVTDREDSWEMEFTLNDEPAPYSTVSINTVTGQIQATFTEDGITTEVKGTVRETVTEDLTFDYTVTEDDQVVEQMTINLTPQEPALWTPEPEWQVNYTPSNQNTSDNDESTAQTAANDYAGGDLGGEFGGLGGNADSDNGSDGGYAESTGYW